MPKSDQLLSLHLKFTLTSFAPFLLSTYSTYFCHKAGDGTPWQITSTVNKLWYSFPRYPFNPLIWQPVPEKSTTILSSKSALTDLKTFPVFACRYFDPKSSGRRLISHTRMNSALLHPSDMATPYTTPDCESVNSASKWNIAPDELLALTSAFPEYPA